MRHFQSYLAAAALCLFIPTGCGPSSDDSEGELRITRQEVCSYTECDIKAGENCSQCKSACYHASGTLDCDEACDHSCAPRDCTGSPCVETKVAFVVSGPADPGLEAVCLRFFSSLSSGQPNETIRNYCHVNAQVYLPEPTIGSFECAMREGCPADGSYVDPAPGTVGDEYCSVLNSFGLGCVPEDRVDLNSIEPFCRPETVAALRSCLGEPSVLAVTTCVEAWRSIGM